MPDKRYTYSKRAERDLIDIYLTTAKEWGSAQADKYDAGLEKTVKLLTDSSTLGRNIDHIKVGCHRFEYERHIIFYRKRETDILIIRILHDRMDVERHL